MSAPAEETVLADLRILVRGVPPNRTYGYEGTIRGRFVRKVPNEHTTAIGLLSRLARLLVATELEDDPDTEIIPLGEVKS